MVRRAVGISIFVRKTRFTIAKTKRADKEERDKRCTRKFWPDKRFNKITTRTKSDRRPRSKLQPPPPEVRKNYPSGNSVRHLFTGGEGIFAAFWNNVTAPVRLSEGGDLTSTNTKYAYLPISCRVMSLKNAYFWAQISRLKMHLRKVRVFTWD